MKLLKQLGQRSSNRKTSGQHDCLKQLGQEAAEEH
jgi:hypothetical protein